MADYATRMLAVARDALGENDREHLAQVHALDDVVDDLFLAIQRHLAGIDDAAASASDAARISETLAFIINLELIGDIVEKNICVSIAKALTTGAGLSKSERAEIDEMCERVISHMNLAVSVYMSRDPQAARQLIEEKEKFRDLEKAATERHFARVRHEGRAAAIFTPLLLDVARDIKRIEAHIAATAHGVLETSGELRGSRLRSMRS